MRSAPMVSIISWVPRSPTLQIFQAISVSPTSQHRNMRFFSTVNMFRRCIKLWRPSTSGSRDQALRSPAEPLRRRTFSSATPTNLIRGPEWAAWKFGCQSRRDANKRIILGWRVYGCAPAAALLLIKGVTDESSTSASGNTQGRFRPYLGRQARKVGRKWSPLRRLGDVPPEGLAGRSESHLCIADQRLVWANHSALGWRRQDVDTAGYSAGRTN